MSQHKILTDMLTDERRELLRYASIVSGDESGAEDLVQDAWLRLKDTSRRQDIAEPRRLLWRVLRNLAIDARRRIATRGGRQVPGDPALALAELPDERETVEALVIAREELARIQAVVDTFDDRTRIAFEMHRLEGAKLREIAGRLNISVTAAHELVAKAMRHIRRAVRTDSGR